MNNSFLCHRLWRIYYYIQNDCRRQNDGKTEISPTLCTCIHTYTYIYILHELQHIPHLCSYTYFAFMYVNMCMHIERVRQQKHVRWNAAKGHCNNNNNTKYITFIYIYLFLNKNWKKWIVSSSDSRIACDNILMKCELFSDFKAADFDFECNHCKKLEINTSSYD